MAGTASQPLAAEESRRKWNQVWAGIAFVQQMLSQLFQNISVPIRASRKDVSWPSLGGRAKNRKV